MWCFYSEYIKIVYFSLWCSLEKRKAKKAIPKHFPAAERSRKCVWRRKRKRGGRGGGNGGGRRLWRTIPKMWIWIVEMRKYYEIFHWIHPHTNFVLSGYNFFCCCCWCLDCLRKRKASKIWASRSFAPHKHAHTMERNFHLFYSLTKLTSILFLPFYSNIIKAVKRAKVSERRRTICYSVSFRKSLLSPRVCVCARDVCGSVAKE